MAEIKFADVLTFKTVGELDADSARTALLQKQYFPFVKAAGEELPDLFTSEGLLTDCANDLAALTGRAHGSAAWVELRSRRFDGLVRRLGIPHPVPYSRLVLHVADNWSGLALLLGSPNSQIKPTFHQDGRLLQMDYETSESSLNRDTRLAQGHQFLVKADISNCFPSIYSHALDWATRGKATAKRVGGNDGSWQAKLDKAVRDCHDRETKGVMIGPAISNLLAELVLQRVDESMLGKGHDFLRYVDDYTSYCSDRSGAEKFVVDLQHSLAEFRLDLNTRKTRVVDLREGVGEPWMAEVRSHLPAKVTPLSGARFLRHSELLAARYPLSSVLKFAVKTLQGRSEGVASMLVVDELVRLCAFHPHLAPYLASELEGLAGDVSGTDAERIANVLSLLMIQASERAETDVVLWFLYVLRRVLKRQVTKPTWGHLIKMDDDLVLLALAIMCPRARQAIVRRVLGWDYLCETDYQQHWLTRYEFHRVGLISRSDLSQAEGEWMKVMTSHGVKFTSL